MQIDIKIPSPGESITEVAIGKWLVKSGDYVEKDQELAEVETDKATLPLIAPESGTITVLLPEGQKALVGEIAAQVDTSAKLANISQKTHRLARQEAQVALLKEDMKPVAETKKDLSIAKGKVKVTPLAKKKMEHLNLSLDDVLNGLRKLTVRDIELISAHADHLQSEADLVTPGKRIVTRTPLSPLRRKLGRRLVAVKNETAMLTTFNEVDMSSLMDLRKRYQQAFIEKHGLRLGLMSFFVKACAESLRHFPRVNSMTDGEEMITPGYVDISFAVQTDKGLMVPVIQNVGDLSLPDIEKEVARLSELARESKISLEEMTGGTFTITNGGIFGSMLSTPIINPPQSAILGMHNITDRPVAVNGRVEIRPVMYLALSYDHRIIDGKDSVSFLAKVKSYIESPLKLLLAGAEPEQALLGL